MSNVPYSSSISFATISFIFIAALLFGWNSETLTFNLSGLLWISPLLGNSSVLGKASSDVISLQGSSRGYSNWIGCSKHPFAVLIWAPRISWSFPWYSSFTMLIFQFPLFLSSLLIIITSPISIFSTFVLCTMLCDSRNTVRYSLFHRLHAASLHLTIYFWRFFCFCHLLLYLPQALLCLGQVAYYLVWRLVLNIVFDVS